MAVAIGLHSGLGVGTGTHCGYEIWWGYGGVVAVIEGQGIMDQAQYPSSKFLKTIFMFKRGENQEK